MYALTLQSSPIYFVNDTSIAFGIMAFVKGMETGKSAIISQTIISYLLKIICNSFESKIFRENNLPRELVGEGVNFSFIHNIIYRLIFFT